MAKSVTRIFGPFARTEKPARPTAESTTDAAPAVDAEASVAATPAAAVAAAPLQSADEPRVELGPSEPEAPADEPQVEASVGVEGSESSAEPASDITVFVPLPEGEEELPEDAGRPVAATAGTTTSDVTEFIPVAPVSTAAPHARERAEALVAEDGDAESLTWSPNGHAAAPPSSLATLEGRNVSAWFGDHQVLDRVSLTMPAGVITSLIGPSGCGKSTFLRILNRMHELIPSASLAGEVLLDGEDIYDPTRKLVDARKHIGMVFQKPNPFPAMSIYDNVIAGLRLTGTRASRSEKDELVESCLTKAGLWKEVKDRLRAPGSGLSGGQQQRLCIARSLAIRPRVLLMDEPCSALDPTSTRVIEETMLELVHDVTIVIVTHNMQQAQRVSQQCAFFLASHGTPGAIVEHGDTDAMFTDPIDPRTYDYVNGRFG